MARVRISYEFIGEAMRSQAVRAALRQKAEAKRSRADALGASEGIEMETEVSEGTRPKGRPYARLSSKNVNQEWGDRYTDRDPSDSCVTRPPRLIDCA
jgi:hypothetical protein